MANSVSLDVIKTNLRKYIDDNEDKLKAIGTFLWENPEVSYEEVKAHTYLTDLLEENGFTVKRNYLSGTGFSASITNNSETMLEKQQNHNLHLCLICEYDAVDAMGHVAGHNLSSEASIATALALANAMQDNIIHGKITILGTPAESTCGGTKFDMINDGVFENVDFAMMVMPFNEYVLTPKSYLLLTMTVIYHGKAAHASTYPWEGKNALECAIACYNNLALARQSFKKTWSVNAVITNGGSHPNIIPAQTELKIWLRAPDYTELTHLQQRCTPCIEAAAQFNKCEVDWNVNYKTYQSIQHSPVLSEKFLFYAEELGINFTKDPEIMNHHMGSTDFGNISQIVPSICPTFDTGSGSGIHTNAFHDTANDEIAHERTLTISKVMASTAADLFLTPSIIQSVRSDYQVTRTVSGRDLLLLHKPDEI